jgi:hypothetical protein
MRAALTVTKAVSSSPWPWLTAQAITVGGKGVPTHWVWERVLLLLIASYLLLMVRLGEKIK